MNDISRAKVGDRVETNGDGPRARDSVFVGHVSKISHDTIHVCRDDATTGDGSVCDLHKRSTWSMNLNNDVCKFKIITSRTMIKSTIEFFKEMTASDDEKLLKKHGIEDPIGTPTEDGLKLSALISYKTNRAKITEIVTKKEADEKAARE